MRAQYLQRTTGEIVAIPVQRPRFKVSFAWVGQIGRKLDRLFFNAGGPRTYKRHGYPDVEFHQMIAGRRDTFDSYR